MNRGRAILAGILLVTPLWADGQPTTEIKILVQSPSLNLSDSDARQGRVIFWDTPDLQLSRHGVVLRVRHWNDDPKNVQITVKLRPLKEKIPKAWKKWRRLSIESDVVGSEIVEAASYTVKMTTKKFEILARNGFQNILSKKQARLLNWAYARLPWSRLIPFGPAHAHVWKLESIDGLRPKIERWDLPNDRSVFELSFRVPDYYSRCMDVLSRLDLTRSPKPRPKTNETLEAFLPRRRH